MCMQYPQRLEEVVRTPQTDITGLWSSVWVLRIEPKSSGGAASHLCTSEISFKISFQIYFLSLVMCILVPLLFDLFAHFTLLHTLPFNML